MRISFTGTGGTGKSTLVAELSKHPNFENYTIIDSVSRELFAKGIPINEVGDNFDATQLLVMNKHLEVVLTNQNLLCSRCLLDGFCYTEYLWHQGKVHSLIYSYAHFILEKYLSTYDFIFFIRPEFDLINDGVRSSSEDWRNAVAEQFETNLRRLATTNLVKNIVVITGSVEERIKQVLAYVGKGK